MENDEIMTLTLKRLSVIDVELAIIGVIQSIRDEMNNDPDCSEYRKTKVLPASIAKWQKLHAEIKYQFDSQDNAE